MIRTGERYTVETDEQFINRTNFSKLDALKASNIAILDEANDMAEPDEQFEAIKNIPQDIIDHLFAELPDAIVATLQADDREWIHLRDGPVHQIVKLCPERQNWGEGKITEEGVSVSLYRSGANGPLVADEASIPWADIISATDDNAWTQFQKVAIESQRFVLGSKK